MKDLLKNLNKDIEKLKKDCINMYEEYKDNKLFQLLYDSRITGLTYEFTKAGIDFGDRFLPDFLNGFDDLYRYHILDDGGIRYNKEEVERYKKRFDSAIKNRTYKFPKKRPIWFTKKCKPPYEHESLNGNGENEEQIYNTCIEYLKDYFGFIDFKTLKQKDFPEDKTNKEHIKIIKKYLL